MSQHSIEDLREAALTLQEGGVPTIVSIETIEYAITELAALRAWRERAVPLLRALGDARVAYDRDGYEECLFCPWDAYMMPKELGHAADCPVTLARALLAESEASE